MKPKPRTKPGTVRQAAQNLLSAVDNAYPIAFRDFDPRRDISPERHEQRRELAIRLMLDRAAELTKVLGVRRSKQRARV